MANMSHAEGRTEEAIEMINEVVRQVPRHAEPYRHLSAIYGDIGADGKRMSLALLAAHLDQRTPADTWADLGHECEQMITPTLDTHQQQEQALYCYSKGRQIAQVVQLDRHLQRSRPSRPTSNTTSARYDC